MKINYKIVIIMIIALLFISGCSKISNEEEITSVQEESAQVYVLEDISTVKKVEIEHPEEIIIEYRNDEWQTSDLDEVDQVSINDFFNELFSISGTLIDENKIPEEKESLFTFTVYDRENTVKGFSFIRTNNENYLVNEQDKTYYKLESIPLNIVHFNRSTLKPAIPLSVEEISTIQIDQINQQELILNLETQMNEFEKTPFVSGWFLHGPFETEFSIEYKNIQSFLEVFSNLKGTESSQDTVLESEMLKLIISDGENQETLIVEEKNPNEEYYNVYIESHDIVFEIPAHLIEQFIVEPLMIVDNFIAIIPVDAIQKITIESSTHETIIITADEDDSSKFYINGVAIEEEQFRRNYQYLAMLSYNQPISDDDLKINADEEVRITYEYGSNDEDYRTEVLMQAVENSDEYVVTKNDVTEFTVKSEMISKVFEELNKLIE